MPTRLRKLKDGQFDAILLAAAGLIRLNLDLSDFIIVKLNVKEFIPAPAQGVLAFQTRAADLETRKIVKQFASSKSSGRYKCRAQSFTINGRRLSFAFGRLLRARPMGNYHVWAAKAETWNRPVKRMRISSSTSFQLAEQVLEALLKA